MKCCAGVGVVQTKRKDNLVLASIFFDYGSNFLSALTYSVTAPADDEKIALTDIMRL